MKKSFLPVILLIVFCGIILSLSIRGILGNPNQKTLNQIFWTENGPLELSPERGKFALTYSVIEDNSVFFSTPVARFATPDLGYHDGHFVTLFPPGISYLTIPGYLIGKSLGASQLGTYAVISLFAIFNVLLIRAILLRLKVNDAIASLSALCFLFATTAFAYAVSLYQHHVSTFIILACIYTLIRFKSIWGLIIIWFLLAVSLTIDNSNLFLTFPIGIYALGRLVYLKSRENGLKIGINLIGILTIFVALIPLLAFAWFNKMSYGNPTQLSGGVAAVKALDAQDKPSSPEDAGSEDLQKFTNDTYQEKSVISFFVTRNMLNGFYVHTISPDRGILFYTPVILFGILGIFYFYRKNGALCGLFISLIGTNILLYSMWADPWGGWAFGSRYLIPTYAILSIFLGFVLLHLNRYLIFLLLFFAVFCYSVVVNTVGAITSNRNPPQVEVLNLEKISGVEQKYTFDRNFQMLSQNKSKSFFFNVFASKHLTAWQYYFVILYLIFVPVGALLVWDYLCKKGKNYDKTY